MSDPIERRREQNRTAPRADVRGVTPSSRNFAQAIDRQRQAVERIPLLRAERADLVEVAQALDAAEVAALAISIDEREELPLLAQASAAVSVPVLRCDLLLEEFQIYESRAAGADAVLLVAALLPGESLARLIAAARGTHQTACVLCTDAAEVARAQAARADVFALPLESDGAIGVSLLDALPQRALILAVPAAAAPHLAAPDSAQATDSAQASAVPLDLSWLNGRADAALDPTLADLTDPAESFRRALAGGSG